MLTKAVIALSAAFALSAASSAMAMAHSKNVKPSDARAETIISTSVGSHLAGDDALFIRAKGYLH